LALSLAEREFMTPAQAEGADVAAVARFLSSDLGRWFKLSAQSLKREVSFTFAASATEVYGRLGDGPDGGSAESVLVQGIIDAIVDEPDGLTIIDFKTDRVPAERVASQAEKYRIQISLYRRAVESIWGRPAKGVILYFLSPGRAVRIFEPDTSAPTR
jgi:ATP-dependent helicase/nuclease subunit A